MDRRLRIPTPGGQLAVPFVVPDTSFGEASRGIEEDAVQYCCVLRHYQSAGLYKCICVGPIRITDTHLSKSKPVEGKERRIERGSCAWQVNDTGFQDLLNCLTTNLAGLVRSLGFKYRHWFLAPVFCLSADGLGAELILSHRTRSEQETPCVGSCCELGSDAGTFTLRRRGVWLSI